MPISLSAVNALAARIKDLVHRLVGADHLYINKEQDLEHMRRTVS